MNWFTQASTSAQKSDSVFFFVFALSLFFLVFITGTMIYFVFRYSKKRHPEATQIEGNTLLEIVWTVVPLVLFLAIFYYGWTNFDYVRNAPRDAMVVKVTARQWNWSFEYPNGKQSPRLYAALDRPMKLEVRTLDVIHGFFVPAFRLKIDAVPGRTNATWFQPTRLGAYDVECTVICGTQHAAMLTKVLVVPENEFKAWYFGDEGTSEPGQTTAIAAPTSQEPEVPALALLKAKNCLACHSLDGKTMVGPTFKGLMGRNEELVTAQGLRGMVVDEKRMKSAILNPKHDLLRGYPPTMPAGSLSAQETEVVVAFLKTVK